MSRFAMETGSINLDQGFPGVLGSEKLRNQLANAVIEGPNRYPLMMEFPAIRQAVASHNKKLYGLNVDWQTEVMIPRESGIALISLRAFYQDAVINYFVRFCFLK